jgi:hypothetical protein
MKTLSIYRMMASRSRNIAKTNSKSKRASNCPKQTYSFGKLQCIGERIGALQNEAVLDEILDVFLTDPAVAQSHTEVRRKSAGPEKKNKSEKIVMFDLSIVSDAIVDKVIEILDREHKANRKKIEEEPILLGPASSADNMRHGIRSTDTVNTRSAKTTHDFVKADIDTTPDVKIVSKAKSLKPTPLAENIDTEGIEEMQPFTKTKKVTRTVAPLELSDLQIKTVKPKSKTK